MKILLLTHCFPPAKDGGSMTFFNLATGLAAQGVEVEVITSNCYSTDDFINPNARKLSVRTEKRNGFIVTRLNVFTRGRLAFRLLEKIFGQGLFTALKKGPLFTDLGELFKKRNVDWVISGFFPLLTSFWAYLVSRRLGAKLAIIPGLHPQELDHQNKFLFNLLPRAKVVFCATGYEKKHCRKIGLKNNRISIIGGMVDDLVFDSFPRRKGVFPKKPTVLFLGVKAAHKRIEVLVEAMKIVWQRKDARLVVAGAETLHSSQIGKLISTLKDQSKVSNYSHVNDQVKVELIDQSTVLVNPSQYESFGDVFVESWARKKPVIAADIPALREVIDDGKDGFLFANDSVAGLAEKIFSLVNRPGLAKKMGQAGYHKAVKNYRRQIVVKKIIEVLDQR